MKLSELEQIVNKVKEYNLENVISDFNGWIASFNNVSIKNFLSLDIKPCEFLQEDEHKAIFVDLNHLKSDYYLKDIELINKKNIKAKSANYLKLKMLSNLACNEISLNSKYHEYNMQKVLEADSINKARCLYKLATCDKLSEAPWYKDAMNIITDTNKEYNISNISKILDYDNIENDNSWFDDIERISKAKTKEISDYLVETATNENRNKLDEEDYNRISQAISNASAYKKAQCLKEIGVNNIFFRSINDREEYKYIISKISDARNDVVADCIKDTVLCRYDYDNNYCLDAVNLISITRSDERAKILKEVAVSYSAIINPLTKKNLKLIFDTDSDERAIILGKVAKKTYPPFLDYQENDIAMIYDASSIEKAKILSSIALNDESLESLYHNKDMELVFETDSLDTAKKLSYLATATESLYSQNHLYDMYSVYCENIKNPIDRTLKIAELFCDNDKEKDIDQKMLGLCKRK